MDSIPTRQTLLARLKDLGDDRSWREFFETYWRLIHATACKAGLEEIEAEEVVQEVMISAAKKMPEFSYDPVKDSLKGWLLGVTRWKVADQFRKRPKTSAPETSEASSVISQHSSEGDVPHPDASDRALEPHTTEFETLWEEEWRENLRRSALDRVKLQVKPAHYEMYYLHILEGVSAPEAARILGVSSAAIHLAKYRVGRKVRAELRRLLP